jgi:hypothetical protein
VYQVLLGYLEIKIQIILGHIEENGVGKFNDLQIKLDEIKALGATYIWYTGVPHHALVGIIANWYFK